MRATRGTLSPAVIQRAAHAIALEDGLDAVSMRRVAGALGVWPTALYHHVGDKDGLLRLVLDAVLAEVEVPSDDLPWDDWLRRFWTSARRVLLAHPGVAAHLAEHGNWSPPALEVADRALAVLRRDGADAEQAAVAYSTSVTFVLARVRHEERFVAQADVADEFSAALGAAEAPLRSLREVVPHWVAIDPGALTDEGTELLLAGFRSRYGLR